MSAYTVKRRPKMLLNNEERREGDWVVGIIMAIVQQAAFDVMALHRAGLVGPDGSVTDRWREMRAARRASVGYRSAIEAQELMDFWKAGGADRLLMAANMNVDAQRLLRKALLA